MTNIFSSKNIMAILFFSILTYIVIYMMYPELFGEKKEYFQNNKNQAMIKRGIALAWKEYMENKQ